MDENRVLVVEDEAITAMEIQSNLQSFGYEVPAIAASGEEAIKLADKFNPNLILMDIVLNGQLDGTETALHITQHHNHKVPIIFLTAYSDPDTFNRAKLTVPYGYLTKPFDERDLRMAVELALFKHKMERQSELETMRLKNEFLSNMSHELLDPLNGINTFFELMNNDKLTLDVKEQKEMIKDGLFNSHRLINLVNSVLELTEIESGNVNFTSAPIQMESVINKVLGNVISEHHAVNVSLKIDSQLNQVTTDHAALEKILHHYISNAIKFSPKDCKIEISVYPDPESEHLFYIEVNDNGIGISEESVIHLFHPFKQLDMSMSKKYQGAGLGLALTRHITEALGGRVGVESQVGRGSKFYAVLPKVLKS